MTAPRRIQRSRAMGWRMPPGAVYVGRPGIFGNPWLAGSPGEIEWRIGAERFYAATAASIELCGAVGLYRLWLRDDTALPSDVLPYPLIEGGPRPWLEALSIQRCQIISRLPWLAGRDLVCWCPEGAPHCHADVLLELANREEVTP